jgi:hypothetical protein
MRWSTSMLLRFYLSERSEASGPFRTSPKYLGPLRLATEVAQQQKIAALEQQVEKLTVDLIAS